MENKNLKLVAEFVHEDEPATALFELNLMSPESRGWHRYRIIRVVRDGRIFEYREDMGLSKTFKASEVRILGGVIDENTKTIYCEHTVGELVEMANQLKVKPSVDKEDLPNLRHEKLIPDYHDEMERRGILRRN